MAAGSLDPAAFFMLAAKANFTYVGESARSSLNDAV
jgi:hypothetical protein